MFKLPYLEEARVRLDPVVIVQLPAVEVYKDPTLQDICDCGDAD